VIHVKWIRGKTVSIGVEAPRAIQITRGDKQDAASQEKDRPAA
jgi:sRNA-binding carbon storage regulator CsrA